MIRTAIIGFLAAVSPAVAQTTFDVPSGQPLELFQMELVDVQAEGLTLYLGLLAPMLGDEHAPIQHHVADQDMEVICADYAIAMAEGNQPEEGSVTDVSIRLMDRPVPYGVVDPDAVQFMGFYDISSGACVWN